MIKILVLDDAHFRHERVKTVFENCTSDYEITSVFSYVEAVEAAHNQTFDLMFLDYDLGTPKNGLDFVRHLLEDESRLPTYAIIHSAHIYGAREMHLTFSEAGFDTVDALDLFDWSPVELCAYVMENLTKACNVQI